MPSSWVRPSSSLIPNRCAPCARRVHTSTQTASVTRSSAHIPLTKPRSNERLLFPPHPRAIRPRLSHFVEQARPLAPRRDDALVGRNAVVRDSCLGPRSAGRGSPVRTRSSPHTKRTTPNLYTGLLSKSQRCRVGQIISRPVIRVWDWAEPDPELEPELGRRISVASMARRAYMLVPGAGAGAGAGARRKRTHKSTRNYKR